MTVSDFYAIILIYRIAQNARFVQSGETTPTRSLRSVGGVLKRFAEEIGELHNNEHFAANLFAAPACPDFVGAFLLSLLLRSPEGDGRGDIPSFCHFGAVVGETKRPKTTRRSRNGRRAWSSKRSFRREFRSSANCCNRNSCNAENATLDENEAIADFVNATRAADASFREIQSPR